MLLDQYGRALELLGPLATRETAGEFFFDVLGTLPDPDPVLRKLGDEARVLADLEADDQVTALSLARKNRVLNKRDYWFKPGALRDEQPGETAKLLCDRLVKDLERLNMREIISGILTAPFHGLAALEITWAVENGWWRVKNVELKPPWWFGFDRENKLVFKGAAGAFGAWRSLGGREASSAAPSHRPGPPLAARPVPEGKIILARHFPTYENPYGLRLLSRCLWPVAFKKGGLSFYTRFLEKFGAPWAVAYAPAGAKEGEMDRLAAQLARMVRDATAVLPYGAKLELAAGAAGGTGEQHEAYLKRMDAAIAKVIAGNTLTSEVGERGSYAAAQAHQEGAEQFAEADRDLVITALNDLAWYYARLNAGPEEMAPVFDYEEPADLDKLAELDRKLFALGVRFNNKHFENRYALPAEEFSVTEEAPLLDGAFAASVADPARDGQEGGEAAYWDAISGAVRKYAPAAAGEEIIKEVWKVVDGARDFEDLERGLAGLLGAEVGPGDFEDLLGELMVGANLMGRFAEAGKR